MHKGTRLSEVVSELERRVESRKDFVAPARMLRVEGGDSIVGLPTGKQTLTPWATSQMLSHFQIPTAYYDRCPADLKDTNLNHWLEKSEDKRLVRTLDGQAQAWLSDRYRPLDNLDLSSAVVPILNDHKAMLQSVQITDTRFYLKATIEALTTEVKSSRAKGDVVQGGVVISNSELGNGALSISLFVTRLICLNGMIAESLFRKAHLGRGIKELEQAQEYYTDSTRALDDAAFWSKVRDVLTGSLQEEHFMKLVGKFDEAAEQKLDAGKLDEIVDVTTRRLGLPVASSEGILRNLIEAGDISRWGLANAVTALSNTEQDYETATLAERVGGQIIEMPPSEWKLIAEAVAPRQRLAA